MTGHHPRVVLGMAIGALVALLAIFAAELIESQSAARQDVEHRFSDRAKASAALTESLFGAASTTARAENARRYGGARVSTRTLAREVKQSNSPYLLVLSKTGEILGASPGTPPAVRRAVQARPAYVRQALRGRPFTISDFQRAGLAKPTLSSAQSFPTRFGRRALVSGLDPQLIHAFLGGYLKQIPNVERGRAYVLDRRGAIVASPSRGARPGAVAAEPGLVAALAKADGGSFGSDGYFASDAVAGTPWRVVLTAPEAELFHPVNGTRKWVPWILFFAFTLAASFALVLLGRVLRDAARLAGANTQLAVANQTLERRAGELARSNDQLERFASIASHDLQEPLRKVQTFAERLSLREGDQLSDTGRDYLGRMTDAARRMQSLIDDLLAFSRITTRSRPPEPVELSEVAHEVIADLDAVVGETGGTVEVGQLPTVSADPLLMRQLLQNLVSNALKFHREGAPPVVRIDGRVRGGLAEISVSDNGIGFEPRHAERIFRVFERLHGRETYAGTGIGLALCRRIVESHRGAITADSVPGQGSTFTVTLPLERAGSPPASDAAEPRGEEERLVHA